ncbi:uncharacterized protein LOC144660713 [Oculina patagonica]
MWSDSFIVEVNAELSQVNFSTSYQLFGGLGEQQPQNDITGQAMQQPPDCNMLPPQPYYPYQAWSNSNEQNEQMDYSYDEGASGCSVMWHVQGDCDEQTYSTAQPQYMNSNAGVNCTFESKSVVVAKIQGLRSENVTLDEEIEEQNRRNSLLMKQIADARAQLNMMELNTANLYNEYHALGETSDRFSKQLDQEEKKLKETASKKQAEILEIKVEAEMVPALREDRDRVAAEIAQLRNDLEDAEIDVSNMTEKFQYEIGIMVLFPFWKLEEEMDRLLTEAHFRVDEGGEERHVGDGYDSEEQKSTSSSNDSSGKSLEENFEENPADHSEENTGERAERSSTTSEKGSFNHVDHESIPSVSASSSLTAYKSGVKTGFDSVDFIEDESFTQHDAAKKQKKKISKLTRLGRWLRRLCCIPQGRKDE